MSDQYQGLHYQHEETMDMIPLLEELIKSLVSIPEEVEIRVNENGSTLFCEIDVLDEDRGKIIGSGGTIIRSIKKIWSALGGKNRKKVMIRLHDD